jgi:hypothetical protein
MNTAQIITQINHLSLAEKLFIMEAILQSIRKETDPKPSGLEEAAALLLKDYREDKGLTAFTALDGEDFHETK